MQLQQIEVVEIDRADQCNS